MVYMVSQRDSFIVGVSMHLWVWRVQVAKVTSCRLFLWEERLLSRSLCGDLG